uniref:Receptor expression-enhancing protein n=1 Tax=Meloidogyne javanica TaxID=6303 RepID=A0A915LSE1_MELJA
MPSLPPMMQKIIADLDKKLHEPGALTNMLDTIEKKTNVKRLHVFAGFVLIYSLYLLFGHWAQLACNITGFLYPAYVSIKAIESHTKEDDTQWLTYWCVFLLWLYMPSTLGALLIYDRLIRPFHLQYQSQIEEKLNSGSQFLFFFGLG